MIAKPNLLTRLIEKSVNPPQHRIGRSLVLKAQGRMLSHPDERVSVRERERAKKKYPAKAPPLKLSKGFNHRLSMVSHRYAHMSSNHGCLRCQTKQM